MSDDTKAYSAVNGTGSGKIAEPELPSVDPESGLAYMTVAREAHLAHIAEQARVLINTKYRKGQSEHGGNLWDLPVIHLVDNAIDEAVDQVVYLLTIREKLVGR